MRTALIAALVALGPAAAVAQNSNTHLRNQLNQTPMERTELDFDSCVAIADDYAYTAPHGFTVESNTDTLFTVRIFERNNRVLRITCYQGQMFQEAWTQRRR